MKWVKVQGTGRVLAESIERILGIIFRVCIILVIDTSTTYFQFLTIWVPDVELVF
jgi:uncharacterized membrane protein